MRSVEQRIKRLEEAISVNDNISEITSAKEFALFFKLTKIMKQLRSLGVVLLPTTPRKNKNITMEFAIPYDADRYNGSKSAPDCYAFTIYGSLSKLTVSSATIYTDNDQWSYYSLSRAERIEALNSPEVRVNAEQPRVIKKYENSPMSIEEYEDAMLRIVAYVKKNIL